MTMPFQKPISVVVLDEFCNGDSRFLDGFEIVHIEDLLLQRPVKAFDDAVALGTSYERRRESQTEIVHLPSKIF